MKYSRIVFPDTFSNNGIGVALYINDNGIEFTSKSLEQLVSFLDGSGAEGLAVYGKDLLNSSEVCDVVRTIRAIFGKEKEIRLYTNMDLNEILSNNEIHEYIDGCTNINI